MTFLIGKSTNFGYLSNFPFNNIFFRLNRLFQMNFTITDEGVSPVFSLTKPLSENSTG